MTPPASQAPSRPSADRPPPWPGTQSAGTARIASDGREHELPVVVGTEGERAIDIGRLRAQTGLITLDEG